MPDENEKQALIHECVMLKGQMDWFEGKYKAAKAALQTLMEESGDATIESADGRAFYQDKASMVLADAEAVARLLNKDELVDLVAGQKITQGDVNFLTSVTTGRNISALFTQVPIRIFIVEKSRTKAEKERIQFAIDKEAEAAAQQLVERVNGFRKRLGLGRSDRLPEPKGKDAQYSGRGRGAAGGKKKSARAKKS